MLAAGLFMAASAPKTVVEAQEPKCECWGTMEIGHYLMPNFCAVVPFFWEGATNTLDNCEIWCKGSANFLGSSSCNDPLCGEFGNTPSFWQYSGHAKWYGTDPGMERYVSNFGSCTVPPEKKREALTLRNPLGSEPRGVAFVP
jgi:hypothetical protein